MSDMTEGIEIEFFDASDESGEHVAETVASERRVLPWLLIGALFVVCGWIVASPGAVDPEDVPVPDSAPHSVGAPQGRLIESDRAAAIAIERPGSEVWPSPQERDPNVTRTVGPSQPPEEFASVSLESSSLVYVATSGRPTVVSLETGDVLTVGVAAIRVHETFAVEAGQVVSAGEAADPERGAFVFHTYRDVDGPGVGRTGTQRGIGVGPELCLLGESCLRPGASTDRVAQAGMVVERFDPVRHRALGDLLESWTSVDGELVSPEGYRMPEPVGVIWVISPTSGGSVSSSGLL